MAGQLWLHTYLHVLRYGIEPTLNVGGNGCFAGLVRGSPLPADYVNPIRIGLIIELLAEVLVCAFRWISRPRLERWTIRGCNFLRARRGRVMGSDFRFSRAVSLLGKTTMVDPGTRVTGNPVTGLFYETPASWSRRLIGVANVGGILASPWWVVVNPRGSKPSSGSAWAPMSWKPWTASISPKWATRLPRCRAQEPNARSLGVHGTGSPNRRLA